MKLDDVTSANTIYRGERYIEKLDISGKRYIGKAIYRKTRYIGKAIYRKSDISKKSIYRYYSKLDIGNIDINAISIYRFYRYIDGAYLIAEESSSLPGLEPSVDGVRTREPSGTG